MTNLYEKLCEFKTVSKGKKITEEEIRNFFTKEELAEMGVPSS